MPPKYEVKSYLTDVFGISSMNSNNDIERNTKYF